MEALFDAALGRLDGPGGGVLGFLRFSERLYEFRDFFDFFGGRGPGHFGDGAEGGSVEGFGDGEVLSDEVFVVLVSRAGIGALFGPGASEAEVCEVRASGEGEEGVEGQIIFGGVEIN